MEKEVYILLGTNLGDRGGNLSNAIGYLEDDYPIEIVERSSVYVTEAWGITDQPAFYNQVLHIQTNMTPENLLAACLDTEKKIGRVRYEHWGPRLIDIDVLFYGSQVIKSKNITIPHPHLHERNFTLEPLAAICPDFFHPVLKKDIQTLLKESPDTLKATKKASQKA
jgi:2-amino-4-hydroxy-6-hydroxymethyldihydropteridine diphosphokinase